MLMNLILERCPFNVDLNRVHLHTPVHWSCIRMYPISENGETSLDPAISDYEDLFESQGWFIINWYRYPLYRHVLQYNCHEEHECLTETSTICRMRKIEETPKRGQPARLMAPEACSLAWLQGSQPGVAARLAASHGLRGSWPCG